MSPAGAPPWWLLPQLDESLSRPDSRHDPWKGTDRRLSRPSDPRGRTPRRGHARLRHRGIVAVVVGAEAEHRPLGFGLDRAIECAAVALLAPLERGAPGRPRAVERSRRSIGLSDGRSSPSPPVVAQSIATLIEEPPHASLTGIVLAALSSPSCRASRSGSSRSPRARRRGLRGRRGLPALPSLTLAGPAHEPPLRLVVAIRSPPHGPVARAGRPEGSRRVARRRRCAPARA
jgi:hypothetical protein